MISSKSVLITILIFLLLTACSQEEPTAPPTPTPNPQQLLELASTAMAAVDSVQFNLSREGQPLLLDSSLGAYFVSAAGEFEAPDRVHANVKADINQNLIALDFLWLPEGVYMTNPLTGQYMEQPLEVPLDPSKLFDPQVGLSRILISKIEEPTIMGSETIDGREAVHLSGKTDAETVTIILPIDLEGQFELDIWLDASSYEVLRIQITEENGDKTSMDFIAYGEPVDIPVPE